MPSRRIAQRLVESYLGALAFAAQYHLEELAKGMGDMFGEMSGDSPSGGDDWADDGWEDDGWEDDGESSDEYDQGGEDKSGYDSPSSLPQGVQLKPQYEQKLFVLELVNDYYADMIGQELARSAARRKEIDDRYDREMTELKKGAQIAGSHFYAWRDLTLDSCGRLKFLLLEYWKMSDQVTAGIYDQDVIDYVNQIRELVVVAACDPPDVVTVCRIWADVWDSSGRTLKRR
jgi:hypothetical protein